MRSQLSLREPPQVGPARLAHDSAKPGQARGSDAPRVKEAKQIVAAALGTPEPDLVPWTMRLAEARDTWANGKRKRA